MFENKLGGGFVVRLYNHINHMINSNKTYSFIRSINGLVMKAIKIVGAKFSFVELNDLER